MQLVGNARKGSFYARRRYSISERCSLCHKFISVRHDIHTNGRHDYAIYARGGSIHQKYRRYIADIDIQYLYRIGTSDIVFFRYRYRIDDSEILVIFRYFIIFSRLFNVNLKIDNYMITIEYRIRQCDASIVTPVTSLPLY